MPLGWLFRSRKQRPRSDAAPVDAPGGAPDWPPAAPPDAQPATPWRPVRPAARPRHLAEESSPFGFGRAPTSLSTPVRSTPRSGRPAGEGFSSTGPYGHRSRMRARLLTRGAGALADYEVLEMLLFLAFKKGDTKPLAKELINRYGSFAAVITAPQEELLALPGLGEHSVTALKLVQEAALRLGKAEVMEQPVLANWEALTGYLGAALARERVEQSRVLYLDSRNRLLKDEAHGRGTVNQTPLYPREIIRRALDLGATALILVHNHPSGDPSPSRADIDMTEEVCRAGEVFSIVVHDHLIVGNGRTLSFRQEGLLG